LNNKALAGACLTCGPASILRKNRATSPGRTIVEMIRKIPDNKEKVMLSRCDETNTGAGIIPV